MILISELFRYPKEQEQAFLWRVGQAKDSGEIDVTWEQIATYMNGEFRDTEEDYRTESAYRKQYATAKNFYESVFVKQLGGDAYLEQLREERQELYKVKTQVRDERNELNRKLRGTARLDSTLDALGDTISALGKDKYAPTTFERRDGGTDLLCCLSDIHYGIEFDSYTGKYNSDIAYERIMRYAHELADIGKRHGANEIWVSLLGDQLSGIIHPSISIENRENLVEQIIGVSEIIADFIYALSCNFQKVHVNSVGGNHSRVQPKDVALKDERLDNLIIWHLQAKFSHMRDSVCIVPISENIDSTVAEFTIRGKSFVSVHGDYDPFTDAGLSKLVMWLGYKPFAVLSGHMHTPSYKDVSSVICIQSGSLSGSGDAYTTEKRLRGLPSQTACVIGNHGIVAMYPVSLA